MLNKLKQAIRKKKLRFTVKYSTKNINKLNQFLNNKLITSFVILPKNSIIVLINYCHTFNGSWTDTVINSKTTSNQQNKIIHNARDVKNLPSSNFVISINFTDKLGLSIKPSYCVKFR